MTGRLIRITIALACAAFGWAPRCADAQLLGGDDEPPTIADQVSEGLTNTWGSFLEAGQHAGAASLNIQGARKQFFATFPDKPGHAEARAEFGRRLLGKDYFHFVVYLPAGPYSAAAFVGDLMLIDGGIHPGAQADFYAFVRKVRQGLGARRDDDLILIDPTLLLPSIAAAIDDYRRYCVTRDFLEFEAAGVDMRRLLSAEDFVVRTMARQLSLWNTDDPARDARAMYDEYVKTFGAESVRRAANATRAAPADARGWLTPEVALRPSPNSDEWPVESAFDLFGQKLRAENARAYAVAAYITNRGDARAISQGRTRFERAVAGVDPAAVERACVRLYRASKSPDERFILGLEDEVGRGMPLTTWFEHLLREPATPDPAIAKLTSVRADDAAAVAAHVGKGWIWLSARVVAVDVDQRASRINLTLERSAIADCWMPTAVTRNYKLVGGPFGKNLAGKDIHVRARIVDMGGKRTVQIECPIRAGR